MIQCCIPIEWIQPWDQDEAIRQVAELGLGNMVMLQGTFHVGNADADRAYWKQQFPTLAAQIDAVPRFPERPQSGMTALLQLPLAFRLDQLRLCRELGLQVMCFCLPSLGSLTPAECADVMAAAGDALFSECFMCENLSILGGSYSLAALRELAAKPVISHSEAQLCAAPGAEPSPFDDPESLDFQAVHDWLVGRFRAAGERIRESGVSRLSAIEASSQTRLAMAAGADVPVLELVPHEPLPGIAATRGAAKAYRKDLWGVHFALGYYRAPVNEWTPERLQIAYNLFYAAGAGLFTECNLPLKCTSLNSAFFSIRATPPIQAGDLECREFDDPLCVRGREIVSEFYRFSQLHQRPAAGPQVRMGYLLGHLDSWTGASSEYMWLAELPGFRVPEALATWRHFARAYDWESWYVAPRKYYWQADPAKPLRYGTPPCGQVDIVPVEAPVDVLATYGCLAFLGWNTMTEAQYAQLIAYVEQGGILFLGVPHCDTRTRHDQPPAFLRDGDLSQLCGVRILGRGEDIEEIYFDRQSAVSGMRFPQGALYLEPATMTGLTLCGARVLAFARDRPAQPVLLEHRLGKGTVFLLANWRYPGAELDAFIADILRALAEQQQADISVTGRDVYYAVYAETLPSGVSCSCVYLVNHDIYGQPAFPLLTVPGLRAPVRVGRELRIVWVFDEFVISPADRFVTVVDARKSAGAWELALVAQPPAAGVPEDVARSFQIAATGGRAIEVELDGQSLTMRQERDGDRTVQCALGGRQTLRLQLTGA